MLMIHIDNTYLDDFIPNWHNRPGYVQYHVLVLITEGRLLYRLNGESFAAAKGDLLFIPSGTHRESMNDGATLHQKYAVLFSAPELDLSILKQGRHVLIRSRGFEYFKEKMTLLHRHTIEKRPFYETIRIGILLELLGMASREMESPPIPLRKLKYVRAIEQYILDRFREPIALQELAALIGRSPNYTLAVFKETTGQTPLEYMHHLRITAAMNLLHNTDLTIRDIAEHLGYYDTSYFYRMFRKSTGMSPSGYANRGR